MQRAINCTPTFFNQLHLFSWRFCFLNPIQEIIMLVKTLFINKETSSISFRLTEGLNQFAYRILLYVMYFGNNLLKDRVTSELSEKIVFFNPTYSRPNKLYLYTLFFIVLIKFFILLLWCFLGTSTINKGVCIRKIQLLEPGGLLNPF